MKILAISGSLRKNSFNTSLLKHAQALSPEGMQIEIVYLHEVPLYDADVEMKGLPEVVVKFKEAIRKSDALLISCPEYNSSVSGVLKNAIDWFSRPPEQPLNNKKIAIIGASTGIYGTVRAQLHLRQVLQSLNAHVLPKPEVMISSAKSKFDESGNLTDVKSIEILQKFLVTFQNWLQ